MSIEEQREKREAAKEQRAIEQQDRALKNEERRLDQEEQALRNSQQSKTWSKVTSIMIFVAFMGWIFSSLVISNNQTNAVMTNRAALECLIQQLSEHRVNNRIAHAEDGHHHGYIYTVPSDNVPSSASLLDPRVCDKWLNLIPLETSPTTARPR